VWLLVLLGLLGLLGLLRLLGVLMQGLLLTHVAMDYQEVLEEGSQLVLLLVEGVEEVMTVEGKQTRGSVMMTHP
jgi:hypothetical protein